MSNALLTRLSLVTACALAWAGCTVHKADTPALSGPSEFALSFAVSASPDAISQDGGSQSAVVVKAFDAKGAPKPAVTFRLAMFVAGTPVDYGTLSTKIVVTGADGRATAIYTAPAPFPDGTNLPTCSPALFSGGLPGGCLEIAATPVGAGFTTSRSETVAIHLVPLGVILPPAATPTAAFTFNPSLPTANAPVQFDASSSCPGQTTSGGACPSSSGSMTNYFWEFSDGGTASGRLASHTFTSAQTYSATLTVTNDRGVKASASRQIAVGAGSAPTAAFVFSPTPVVVGARVYFDASNSRAGVGHTIASYQWNWGDNESASGSASPLQDHDYQAAGTYTVLLTVTDEAGQIGTASQTVAVSASGPVPSFFFLKDPSIALKIHVDASASTSVGTSTLSTYTWSWGDTTADTSGKTQTHTYAAAGSYTVRLTVTDSLGRSTTSSGTSVTVP